MMNLTEKNEVISFLKKKKMSYPLYKEILDHFYLEIEKLMDDGLGFQEAFLKTKIKWQEEFRMVHAHPLSVKKIPVIEARTLGNRFRKIIGQASAVASFSIILLMIYPPIQPVITGILSTALIAFLIYSIVTRKLSLVNYLMLTFHPLLLRSVMISLLLMLAARYYFADMSSVRFDFPEAITFAATVFNLFLQIQLLNFHSKKLNVLVS